MSINNVPPRVVIADDFPEMQESISEIIRLHCRIVGIASDGRQAIHEVLHHRPDVILVDVCMPRLDGIQVARRLCALGANCKVIMVTILEDRDYISSALKIGAAGYVFKRKMVNDLLPAIREVMAGRIFVSSHPL